SWCTRGRGTASGGASTRSTSGWACVTGSRATSADLLLLKDGAAQSRVGDARPRGGVDGAVQEWAGRGRVGERVGAALELHRSGDLAGAVAVLPEDRHTAAARTLDASVDRDRVGAGHGTNPDSRRQPCWRAVPLEVVAPLEP